MYAALVKQHTAERLRDSHLPSIGRWAGALFSDCNVYFSTLRGGFEYPRLLNARTFPRTSSGSYRSRYDDVRSDGR